VSEAGPLGCIGEVIASSTTGFTAQCPRALLHQPPAFGALVKVEPGDRSPAVRMNGDAPSATVVDYFAERPAPVRDLPAGTADGTLYAIVYDAATGSAEPSRRPTAYGLAEHDLRQQQPQIFDLLATHFSALHVGYARDGRFHAGLPPRPGRLHAAVAECSPAEVCVLTEAPELLRALVKAPAEAPVDELIAACVRHAYTCRGEDYAYLVRAGKQLAALLRDDPDRLNALLARLEP
jgi:hypothetical protein